jgi:hypothetical protein
MFMEEAIPKLASILQIIGNANFEISGILQLAKTLTMTGATPTFRFLTSKMLMPLSRSSFTLESTPKSTSP